MEMALEEGAKIGVKVEEQTDFMTITLEVRNITTVSIGASACIYIDVKKC